MKKILTERTGVLNLPRPACAEGEVGEELDEGIREKQTPQAMVIQNKAAMLPVTRIILNGRPKLHDLEDNQSPSQRPTIKIRSRSPKGLVQLPFRLGDTKYNMKHLSPQHAKSPQLFARNNNDPSPWGSGKSPRTRSPGQTRRLQCQEAVKNLLNPSPRHASPAAEAGGFKLVESEESQMLEAFAKRKRKVNEELWVAAACGDVVKIDNLLAP